MKNSSLAIAICMYNEEKIANECIDKVIGSTNKLDIRSTIFVVNDGSTDQTKYILDSIIKKNKGKVIVFTHKVNKGFGEANKTAILEAQKMGFDWILHMDAGLTNDPVYIQDFVEYMEKNIDCVKASRYIKDSKVIGVPKYRRAISIFGNYVASILFNVGIRDCTNGFRMVRLKKLKGARFKEKSYAMVLEELLFLKKKRAIFTEIPYTLRMNKKTVSHFIYKPSLFASYLKFVFKSFYT